MIVPSVSIIVPVLNQEKWIGRCLRSLLNQSMNRNNYEIIVINDFSTDKTKSLIEDEFLQKIKLINNDRNYGKGFSVKRGIEAASGDIILIQFSYKQPLTW